jgi:hypothetical protein
VIHRTAEDASLSPDDEVIRDVVRRLSRPHPSGGVVIERAAVLASGQNAPAVLRWIVERAGESIEPLAPSSGGLHRDRSDAAAASRPPLRYVLPPGALA